MPEYVIAKYIRLSLDDAKTDSMSIENQQLLIGKHLAELDMPDARIIEFVDNGYSGTNFERPAVQQLLELVREGKVNCIAVKDFSRFGRNAIETGYFIERVFPLYRVRFIAVSDGFDTINYAGDTGGMEVAFKFLIHEYYSRDLSKKIKTAQHEKMRRGEYVRKNCLFGYKLDGTRKMVIDEPAADTVRLIFKLALEGNSYPQIAKRLYNDNRPTPGNYKGQQKNSSCIWELSTIRKILHDEQYIGVYIAGKTTKVEIGSSKAKKQPESEWHKIPDHHPAIIEKPLFDAVQKLRSPNSTSKHKCGVGTNQRYSRADNPLKGKVACGCCGHIMSLSSTRNAQFQCKYTHAASDAECHRLSIPAQELTDMLCDVISKRAQVILNIDNLNDIDVMELKIVQQAEIEKQIEAYQNEKCRLYEQLVLKEITAEEYQAGKASIGIELDRLNYANTRLIAENEKLSATKAENDNLLIAAKSAAGENTLTRQLVDMLISKVSVFPGDRIEIIWKVTGFGEV